MSGRVTASEPPAKGLAPLHLGTAERGEPELSAEVLERKPLSTVALITTRSGSVFVGPKGAAALADWLHAFARPKPELVLWSVEGIRQECNVSRSTVYKWTAKPDFPRPVPVVGGGAPVWEARAVKAWVRLARRSGGRPRRNSKNTKGR